MLFCYVSQGYTWYMNPCKKKKKPAWGPREQGSGVAGPQGNGDCKNDGISRGRGGMRDQKGLEGLALGRPNPHLWAGLHQQVPTRPQWPLLIEGDQGV